MQDAINFNNLKEYDSKLKEVSSIWQKQKSYSVGSIVQYKGKYLKCITAGTSGNTTLNPTSADIGDTIIDSTVTWEVIGLFGSNGTSINDWATNTEYSVGDLVIYDNSLYKCNTNHTSTTFNANESNWTLIGSKGIDFYTVGESYSINNIVIYDGNLYQCTTAHTATSTFDTTKWSEVSKGGIPYYNSGMSYVVDDQIVYDNKIYKCIIAHTSTSTFDTTKWSEISAGADLPEWQANTSYTTGKYLVHEGTVYKVTTNFTSGTTFSDTNLSAYIAPVMIGADNEDDGTAGLVPTPTTSDISKFLCGDGTWKSASSVPITSDVLWSGIINSVSSGDTITMSNNYTDYDEIVLIGDGQAFRSLVPSLGSAIAYDNDGGSLGSTFEQHFIITFSGNTCNALIWRYGSSVASNTLYIVGIKRTVTTGAYIGKSLLWSGTHLDISSVASITLADDVKDYDSIIFTLGFGIASEYIEIDDSSSVLTFFMESYIGDSANHIKFSGWCDHTTLNFISKQFGTQFTSSNPCSIFIWGLKYLPNPNNYSTTEKEIGTWIDGKKLYQKTFTGSMPTTGNSHNIDISTLGVDTVYDVSGMIEYVNGVLFAINRTNSSSEYIATIITYDSNISNKRINISWGSGVSFLSTSKYHITIKYTKSSS